MQSLTSLRKGSSLASITANCHEQTLPGHLSPHQDRHEVSKASPPRLAQTGEREIDGEEAKGVASEEGAEKKMKGSSRTTSMIMEHSHHSFSCHLCTPLGLGPRPFHCQASLFHKTEWPTYSLLQGKLLAVTFNSTMFYRHDYHSPFALMCLVGVMIPGTFLGQLKTAKDRWAWSERTKIATSGTASVPPVF